ncbi:hypothetical protein CSB37_01865 [bacterium DOLZORAL124_38_8]|nr:MAG: hypothetical protein CSB37_01865 [bacterium DOLZORAL124_38_8]
MEKLKEKDSLLDKDVWLAPSGPLIKDFSEYSENPNKFKFLLKSPLAKIVAGVSTAVVLQLILPDTEERLVHPIFECEFNYKDFSTIVVLLATFGWALTQAFHNIGSSSVFVRKSRAEIKARREEIEEKLKNNRKDWIREMEDEFQS